MLTVRKLILSKSPDITEAMKYGMPFFLTGNKMFCYLWTQKITNMPYLGVVEGSWVRHPKLHSEKRARMKVIYLNPDQDLPVNDLNYILDTLLKKYQLLP